MTQGVSRLVPEAAQELVGVGSVARTHPQRDITALEPVERPVRGEDRLDARDVHQVPAPRLSAREIFEVRHNGPVVEARVADVDVWLAPDQ